MEKTVALQGYQKIKQGLQLVMQSFRDMLEGLGETGLAGILPWINQSFAENTSFLFSLKSRYRLTA